MDQAIIGILIFSIFLMFVFAATLFFGKHQYVKANRFLSVILILYMFAATYFTLAITGVTMGVFHLGYLAILLSMSVIYFYIRTYLSNSYKFRSKHLWHVLPFVIQVVIMIVFALSLSAEERESYSVLVDRKDDFYTSQSNYFLLAVALFYMYRCFRRIKSYKIKDIEEYSYSNEHILKWLYAFIFVMLGIPVIMTIILGLQLFTNIFPVLSITGITWTASVIFFFLSRPEIYQGIGVLAPLSLGPKSDVSTSISEAEKLKLFEQLTSCMESEKIYLDPDLTLKQLAETLKTNQNYLSRAINDLSGKSFREFINSYRLSYARKLLSSGSLSEYTIEGIAKDSGFRSRSVFYRYFKKQFGMSPGAFLEHKEND